MKILQEFGLINNARMSAYCLGAVLFCQKTSIFEFKKIYSAKALQCSKIDLKNLILILSITRQFFRLKLILKDIDYDLKFH